MDVRVTGETRHHTSTFKQHLAELVSSLGTIAFERAFMKVARELCNCEHMTVFARSTTTPPKVLLAVNNGPGQVAHDVARKYVARHWRLDPALRVESTNETVLVELHNIDIDDADYRHDCYRSVGLDRRLSLMRRLSDETVQINVYSRRGSDRPANGMLEIASNIEAIFALVLKHSDLVSPDKGSLTDAFRRRLRVACPELPDREMDVCVAIARGLSSEAMAIEWGISVNTVLTYRKRAYSRLNITSHNELMRLMMCRISVD